MLTFQQFLAQAPHKRFAGLDRAAWSDFAGHHPERLFNMAKREAQVLKLNTPFAETLKQLARVDVADITLQ
eukprot:COSAG01_NODE_49689_length_370_cov_0.538745_1_plen_71_part_00